MRIRAVLLSALLLAGPPAAAEGLYPSQMPEFGPETLSLVRATEELFESLEAESARSAPTERFQLRPVLRDAEPTGLPAAGRHALSAENGPVTNLIAYEITWYPTDRLSGTVDFVGTWKNGRNLVCGYVTWDMSDPARPTLATMTTSYLDTGTLLRLPADAAHAELLRANCAFGEIEPNLELARAPD